MPYRLISLLLIPFLMASVLLTTLTLSNLKQQLLTAEAQLAQTLLQSSTSDAATYFAQSDWVALSAVLEDLSRSIEQSRAEVVNATGQIILANGPPPKTGQTFKRALRFEGQTRGTLSLKTSGEAIDALVFETGVLMALFIVLLASAIALFLAQFGDFVRIWIGLDPPRAARVKIRESEPFSDRQSALKVFFAIKLSPSRLAPLADLRALTDQHGGQLSTVVSGDYEASFSAADPIGSGLLFFEAAKKRLDDIELLDTRFALGIDQGASDSDVAKRTKFLATLSTGDLVIDDTTRALLATALHEQWVVEPFSSPLASDLSLSVLKPLQI